MHTLLNNFTKAHSFKIYILQLGQSCLRTFFCSLTFLAYFTIRSHYGMSSLNVSKVFSAGSNFVSFRPHIWEMSIIFFGPIQKVVKSENFIKNMKEAIKFVLLHCATKYNKIAHPATEYIYS